MEKGAQEWEHGVYVVTWEVRGEERVLLLFITVEWKRLLLSEAAAAVNLPLNEDRPFKVSDAWQPVADLSRKATEDSSEAKSSDLCLIFNAILLLPKFHLNLGKAIAKATLETFRDSSASITKSYVSSNSAAKLQKVTRHNSRLLRISRLQGQQLERLYVPV